MFDEIKDAVPDIGSMIFAELMNFDPKEASLEALKWSKKFDIGKTAIAAASVAIRHGDFYTVDELFTVAFEFRDKTMTRDILALVFEHKPRNSADVIMQWGQDQDTDEGAKRSNHKAVNCVFKIAFENACQIVRDGKVEATQDSRARIDTLFLDLAERENRIFNDEWTEASEEE
jgi:hypothetical protein